MDTVADLMYQFKSEDTHKLNNIDKSQKPNIISSLENFVSDERAMAFLLAVAADENEYDLARIEAFKVLEVIDVADSSVRTTIGHTIRNVLANSEDDGVRNYAAMAASSYMDIENVIDQVERVLQNNQEDSNLRWNAFGAIKSKGPSPQTVGSLRRLLGDKEFAQSATRVLSEWQVS